jgi:hypothetical protein
MNTYNLNNSFVPVSFTPYRHKQYGTKIGNKINFLQVENSFRYMYVLVEGISRVIMSLAELKMQPTIHFQS